MSNPINDSLKDQFHDWLEEHGVTIDNVETNSEGKKYITDFTEGEVTEEGISGSERKILVPDEFQNL